jgi:hypothetical protein
MALAAAARPSVAVVAASIFISFRRRASGARR